MRIVTTCPSVAMQFKPFDACIFGVWRWLAKIVLQLILNLSLTALVQIPSLALNFGFPQDKIFLWGFEV
jgi:hypothetical protein